jgi:Coenzyme PQQ synthesis protein D (PqqD)
MSKGCYVARSPHVAARILGGEMMIMSGHDSTFFTLNEAATLIWEAADGLTTLDEIVELRICAEFEVDPAEALLDANDLAEKLAERGILFLSSEPFPSATVAGGSK